MNRIFTLNTFRKNIFLSKIFLQEPKCVHRRNSIDISNLSMNPFKKDCESMAEMRKLVILKSRNPASAIVDLNVVICNFTDKYLDNFDLAQLNLFNKLLDEARSDEAAVFDWLTGVTHHPPEYQSSLMELLKNHTKEYNIRPLKTRLFDRLESVKNLEYTSDDDKNDAERKVRWAFKAVYEAGLKDIKFTDEEQRLLGDLLVDAFGAFKMDIESTDVFDEMQEQDAVMKRSVLLFMMEDYSQFPARDSILIDELERLNIKDSIKILDQVFTMKSFFTEDVGIVTVGHKLCNFRGIVFHIQCPWEE